MDARSFVFLPLLVVTAACSGSDDGEGSGGAAAGKYPLDDVLRVNHVQMKATHNSYHVETPDAVIPSWQFTRDPLGVQLETQGIRAVELDTHYDPSRDIVEVYHLPGGDEQTTCRMFVDCLDALKTWSDAHPEHHVLFVQIEPKDQEIGAMPDWTAYAEAIDREISGVWPRDRVVTPDDVQKDAVTLRDGVIAGGWPTLGETRGKIAFYIDDREAFHDAYTRGGTDVAGRLMFPSSSSDEPIAAVLVMNDPASDIAAVVAEGFVVRTMADSYPAPADIATRREAALASGAHIVTTDFPVAEDTTEALSIPGGTPSRCNPVSAPSECTSESIEHL